MAKFLNKNLWLTLFFVLSCGTTLSAQEKPALTRASLLKAVYRVNIAHEAGQDSIALAMLDSLSALYTNVPILIHRRAEILTAMPKVSPKEVPSEVKVPAEPKVETQEPKVETQPEKKPVSVPAPESQPVQRPQPMQRPVLNPAPQPTASNVCIIDLSEAVLLPDLLPAVTPSK